MAEPEPTLAEDVAAVLRSAADQIASADLTKLDWQPRRWELPPEPGPEVTAVRCECHGRWERGLGRAWYLQNAPAHMGPYRVYWAQLYGDHMSWRQTLTDATGEQP